MSCCYIFFLFPIFQIYMCCFGKLKASDIDQEVKERAIGCMGQIVATLGDLLSAELPNCLPIFYERLKNEITRLTAVKALVRELLLCALSACYLLVTTGYLYQAFFWAFGAKLGSGSSEVKI